VIVFPTRFGKLRAAQCWWPGTAEEMSLPIASYPVAIAMQCTAAVADALRSVAVRTSVSETVMVSLMQSDDELLRSMSATTRNLIRRSVDDQVLEVTRGDRAAEGIRVLDQAIAHKGFRPRLSETERALLREQCDIFVAAARGSVIAMNAVVADANRARLLFAAVATDGAYERKPISFANRCLLWHEFLFYRNAGVPEFDLGGIGPAGHDRATDGIRNFKLSFGGALRTEYVVACSARPMLRTGIRAVVSVGSMMRR
jgi:hypothetical protein